MKQSTRIGDSLKSQRIKSGKTVKQVVEYLYSQGVTVSESTIYNWENNISMPNAEPTLMMCMFYETEDIMQVFGYKSCESERSNFPVKDKLLDCYFGLNEIGKTKLLDYAEDLNKIEEYRA